MARTAEPMLNRTGRSEIARPARAHMLSRLGFEPNFGVSGQKIQRGQIARANGKTMMPAIIATAIPTNPARPRLRLESNCANHSTAMTTRTVPPDARIAGAVPRTAFAIASARDSNLRSSSR